MGTLDEAIKEHLELKRRQGAGEDEIQKAEAEAFGPGEDDVPGASITAPAGEGDQLDMIGPSLFERFKRLDILVSNAAIMGRVTPAPHIDMRDWNDALAVNVNAALRLIRSCGPLLLAAPEGRAVFISSRIVVKPMAYFGIYGATKAAHHYLVQAWAEETRRSSLRVNLVDPGPVDTAIRTGAWPGEDRSAMPKPADVAPGIAQLCLPGETRHGEFIRVSPLPL